MKKWILLSLIFICFLTTSVIAQVDKGDKFSYTITDTWMEGNSGSVEMIIKQSGERAVALFPEGNSLKQVSDPTAGIRSARPDRNLPVLVNIIEEGSSFTPGDPIILDGKKAVIESIEYSLEKGKEKLNLMDMKTDHSILRIDLVWTRNTEDGKSSKGHYSGTADLWTIKKLPFSWLPYTIPEGFTKAVVPFSFHAPELASFILLHYESMLKKKGLLVKADIEYTIDQSQGGFEMSNQYVRQIETKDLQTISDEIPETPDKPLVSNDRYKSIFGALMAAGKICEKGVGEAVFTAQKEQLVLKSVEGSGTAEVIENDEEKSMSWIAMGILDQNNSDSENGCMVMGIKPQGPESGMYQISSEGFEIQNAGGDNNLAMAFIVNVEEQNPVITFMEEGNVSFRENGDIMKARLQGSGWSFKMERTSGMLTENVQVSTTFDLKPQAKAPEIVIPDWSPLSFTPGSMENTQELIFDEGPSAYGSLDAFGRIAAISLKDQPAIKVVDLEKGDEISTIELPMSLGTLNMSLSMAPSGSTLAIGITGGKVLIANPNTGEITNQWRYPLSGNSFTEVKPLVFNEKRNQVIGSSKGHVVVWDAESGNIIYEWEESGRINDIGVTPDGNYMLKFGSGGLSVLDLETGSEVCKNPSNGPALAVHPDGQQVAIIDYTRKVSILDVKNCEETTSWQVGKGWSPKISWSSDGKHIIMSDYSTGEVMIHDANTGETIKKWDGEANSRIYTATHNDNVLLVGPKILLWE